MSIYSISCSKINNTPISTLGRVDRRILGASPPEPVGAVPDLPPSDRCQRSHIPTLPISTAINIPERTGDQHQIQTTIHSQLDRIFDNSTSLFPTYSATTTLWHDYQFDPTLSSRTKSLIHQSVKLRWQCFVRDFFTKHPYSMVDGASSTYIDDQLTAFLWALPSTATEILASINQIVADKISGSQPREIAKLRYHYYEFLSNLNQLFIATHRTIDIVMPSIKELPLFDPYGCKSTLIGQNLSPILHYLGRLNKGKSITKQGRYRTNTVEFLNHQITPTGVRCQLGQGCDKTVRDGLFNGEPVVFLKMVPKNITEYLDYFREYKLSDIYSPNLYRDAGQYIGRRDGKPVCKLFFIADEMLDLKKELSRKSSTDRFQRYLDITRAFLALHNHAQPLIHNDAKLENVLIQSNGDVVVSDLGRAETPQNRPRLDVSTFVPPEKWDVALALVRQACSFTEKQKSDVWSLMMSILVYEIRQQPHVLPPKKYCFDIQSYQFPSNHLFITQEIPGIINRLFPNNPKKRDLFFQGLATQFQIRASMAKIVSILENIVGD